MNSLAATNTAIMNINKFILNVTLVPSGHNTQPWKFSVNDTVVRIYPDLNHSVSVVDADKYALYISLGCALETLWISAKPEKGI